LERNTKESQQANASSSFREILSIFQRYCAYQDRCRFDITSKFEDLGLTDEHLEGVIKELEEEGFLNEERFARMFVRGHFRKNKWGRIKIKQALQQKNIPFTIIQDALKEVEEKYDATLYELLEKKLATIKGVQDKAVIWNKLQRMGLQKGYEGSLVFSCIKQILLQKGLN